MRKPIVLTATAVPTVLGIAVAALYSLAPTIVPATMPAPDITGTVRATGAPEFMPIVPVAVIDPKGELFIGTGDGSGGGWINPQAAPSQTQAPVKPAKTKAVAPATGRKEARVHTAAPRRTGVHGTDSANDWQTLAGTDRDGPSVR